MSMRSLSPRRSVIGALLATLLWGVSPGLAAPDNPGAYTDPAPAPIQDEQATNDVRRHLRESGVREDVTPDEIHGGVVVTPKPSRPPQENAQPDKAPEPPEPRRIHSARTVVLTAQGLAPARRAGVEAPADSEPQGPLGLLVGALVVAAAAGAVAVRRR